MSKNTSAANNSSFNFIGSAHGLAHIKEQSKIFAKLKSW